MKIKKYIGSTAHEAMMKLKNELGPDAVILNTKSIRKKGLMGFFKKPLVEITVGYEEEDLLQNKLNLKYETKLNSISKELNELKNTILENSLAKSKDHNLPLPLHTYYQRMVKNGVDLSLANRLLKEIREQIRIEGKDADTIKNIVKFTLAEKIGKPQPITVGNNKKNIFFVGPTGVGKTTTLAKVAANLVLENNFDIGLITADTYRVGAIEQLKIYSEILQLPLEIAYNSEDMEKAFDKFSEKDIVLIDTAGRSHNDLNQMEELKGIIDSVTMKEIYLLINANIDYRGLNDIIDKYNFLEDYKLIITKTDELSYYGNLLNIKHITNKEFSYFTTGQNVPDDIQIVNIDNIVDRLIEENIND